MNNVKEVKTIVTAFFAALSSWLGILFVPVMVLVSCNVIDYITGLIAVKYRDDSLSSYKSIKGICKKVGMWILILIGFFVDKMIQYSVETVGLNIHFTFIVACVVSVWLVLNEMLSILENLKDIGTPLPPFLLKIVSYMKDEVEKKSKIEGDEKNEDH